MSRNRRRREEPVSSHWEPGYRYSHSDGRSRRRYGPPTETHPRSSFNYWRDEVTPTTSYHRRRPYDRESYSERWSDDSRRSWYADSSYSRGRRDFGLDRGRGGSLYPRNSGARPRHSTYSPPSSRPPPERHRTPIESISPISKINPPESPRKISPPPDMPSQSLDPSPRYLSLSQQPSEVLPDPAKTRKLLVLDLNGTLLIRSARSRNTSALQLRAVQPRPYMQSFRQYLFCEETKAWLDTMVWSSAQPHSVNDMVDKVFGPTRSELKAIWNRKSLGLSEAEYHRKTVTMKDLGKAWELFASALSPEKLQLQSTASLQSKTVHSAETTLLLDDSPHKAILQPYNHVCIPEYDSTKRQHDLRSFLATKAPKQNKKAARRNQIGVAAQPADHMVPELFSPDIQTGSVEREPYDATLLAVIGILETVKLQSNVAGWIRQGGLWTTQESEGAGTSEVKHYNVFKTEGGKSALKSVVRAGNDVSRASDPIVNPEQADSEMTMWFDDSSVVAFWVARGHKALMELGIQVVHGLTA